MNILEEIDNFTSGRYEFVSLLGKGAFCEVYKAYDAKLYRHVAVKVLNNNSNNINISSEKFFQEARIMARAEHANIVPIHDMFEINGYSLIVMRLIHGDTLKKVLYELKKPMSISQAIIILRKILTGLDFVHSRGIVHLDLKPGNIFLSLSDEILIMDFGIAVLLEEQSIISGKAFGTPYFMSPEQINCSYLDARSDIYSVGIILYLMLTGVHPFQHAHNLEQMVKSHLSEEPGKPSSLVPNLPAQLDNIVLKCLRKKPDERFRNCWEIENELEKIAGSEFERINPEKVELRWDNRVKVNINASLLINDEEKPLPATIIDLSVGGARLRIAENFTFSEYVTIKFDLPDDTYAETIHTKTHIRDIKHSRDDNQYYIGVKFLGLTELQRYRVSIFIRKWILDGNIKSWK